ncbi:MAG: 16S rRNA (adenine(1518)-N(6)/adenine(1519)-N(6))-dimethyltransferase RsmA [Candidatus Njordarchaeota archaeon]
MLSEILKICRKYNIRLSPKLSQHFLHSPNIIEREIKYADIQKSDIVLDIGAGFGFLTERLAEKAKRVYAIEIDKKMISVLRERLSRFIDSDKVIVIEGDALSIDLPKDVNKIVSNPPFHIISPLIFRIAETYFDSEQFDVCVMIVQHDYANKMKARPGEKRSRLSATIQYFADMEILMQISRRNFFPIPKVDAALVRIKPSRKKHIVDFVTFKKVVTLLFSMPNKILRKIIKKTFSRDTANKIILELQQAGIRPEVRLRDLTNNELELLANVLKKYLTP